MVRVEVSDSVRAEVGKSIPAWNAVDRGLSCFFWGTISSIVGIAFLALPPLIASNSSAGIGYDPSVSQLIKFLVAIGTGTGTACTFAAGILAVLGVCFCCASPQTSSRALAIACLAILIAASYLLGNSMAASARFAMDPRLGRNAIDLWQNQLLMIIPIQIMALLGHITMIAYLYLTAGFFGQKYLAKQVFGYAIYQVVASAGVALMFSWTTAANAYFATDVIDYSEMWFYIFVMEVVIAVAASLVGFLWFLRVVLETRNVVRVVVTRVNAAAG